MTTLDSSQWMYNPSSSFYTHTIDQSLRFEDGDNPYLSKTLSGSGGTIFTFSCWLKLGNLSINRCLLQGYSNSSNFAQIVLYSGNYIGMYSATSGTARLFAYTQALQRDPSAWYNIVVKFNGTSGSEEFKIYVNGENQTLTTSTSLSAHQSNIGKNNAHYIGNNFNQSLDMDGYMAEVNFIDGTALDADSFGETKAGIWIPKDTSVLTFGTNGFRLKFQDSSALGDDTSGNGNDFSSSGLAATDLVLDSPVNNWATMNFNDGNGPTISEGNLKVFGDTSYSVFEGFKGTFPMSSGKWYWEVYIDVGGFTQTGITPTTNTAVISTTNLSYHTDAMTYESNGNKAIGTGGIGTAPSGRTTSSYGNSYTDGDIIGVALDLDSSTTTLTFYKNNSSQGTAFSSLASDEYVAVHTGIQNNFGIFNFGQDSSFAGNKTAQGNTDDNGNGDFYYSPPSGFLACCSASLPDPGIDPAEDEEPADYFNTVLYTGNGGTQDITTVGFQPDWVWNKRRDGSASHVLYDSVRGTGKELNINNDAAEVSGVPGVTAFLSNGYSLGNNGNINDSSETYASWNWKINGGTTTNVSAGSSSNIRLVGGGTADQAAVQANTEAGISIVSFENTARGSSDFLTFPHGLNSAPEMVWVKSRDSSNYWAIFHASAGSSKLGFLGASLGTAAWITSTFWNAINSSTVKFLSNGNISATNEDIWAVCFHSVDGYSKMGSFTGNGSADGAVVYTGFRPAWVLIKNIIDAEFWTLIDNKRLGYNEVNSILSPNSNSAEYSASGGGIDILSNGFKLRGTSNNFNGTNDSHIYLAFADQPFKYSNAR